MEGLFRSKQSCSPRAALGVFGGANWVRWPWQLLPVLFVAFLVLLETARGQVTVSNVRAAQRVGTKIVEIDYDISGASGPVAVYLQVSADAGATWTVPVTSAAGAVGNSVSAGSDLRIIWNPQSDWGGRYSTQMRFRVVVDDLADFVNVSGGFFMPPSFLQGNRVDPFYIGRCEVQWGEFCTVRDWGVANKGYDLAGIGSGAGGSHSPVTDLNLFQVLKWCNARSEMEGKMPVYSVDRLIYRTGDRFPVVNPFANGYRLPTRLEWDWAAEGGNQQVIYTYSGGDDIGGVAWYAGNSGGGVHVVGTKNPNQLGIFDMSGNVWEMSYEFGSGYHSFSSNGGGWNDTAGYCARAGLRESGYYSPYDAVPDLGFRLAISQF